MNFLVAKLNYFKSDSITAVSYLVTLLLVCDNS